MDNGIRPGGNARQAEAAARPHAFASDAGAGQVHLRIMETTDLHGNIRAYDYYTDRPAEALGLERTATLVRAARREAANSLLLDNGDALQGSPMGDWAAEAAPLPAEIGHPVIRAMNALGHDGATLGNHDFNYGLDFLLGALDGANFPVVTANVATGPPGACVRDDATLVKPYVILERMVRDGTGVHHPLRIGLIGFVPPQIVIWDRRHLEGRAFARDIVATAAAWLPEMREAGADIVIALAHSGIGPTVHSEGMENACLPLARLAGIDVLLAGHSHLVFPGPRLNGLAGVDHIAGTLHGKPAVMAGFWGSHLGVVDLMLEVGAAGWRITRHAVEARPVSALDARHHPVALVASDPTVHDAVTADHAATLAHIRRPVGRSSVPLQTYFALAAECRAVQLIAEASQHFVAEALADTRHAALPVLAAAAPFKAGGRAGARYFTDIPAGPLAIGNIADLYVYPNTAHALRLSGAQIKDWLERAAAIFNRVAPGARDAPLLDPACAAYEFDVIRGVRYRIDISRPALFDTHGNPTGEGEGRIVGLSYGGAPIDPDAEYILATNNYRAGGGGHYPGATPGAVVLETQDTIRDVILRHVARIGVIGGAQDDGWGFAPVPGATAIIETGPGAAGHLAEVSGVTIKPAGPGPAGFVRYRLHL